MSDEADALLRESLEVLRPLPADNDKAFILAQLIGEHLQGRRVARKAGERERMKVEHPNVQTNYLRVRLNSMGLSELQEFHAYLNAMFRAKKPGEWDSVDDLKAFERLVQEVEYAVREKIAHFLAMAARANVEGPFEEAK